MAKKKKKSFVKEVDNGIKKVEETLNVPAKIAEIVVEHEKLFGPLSVYRKERWQRLEARGYVFDTEKNRANLGHPTMGTVAQPEKGDPGYES